VSNFSINVTGGGLGSEIGVTTPDLSQFWFPPRPQIELIDGAASLDFEAAGVGRASLLSRTVTIRNDGLLDLTVLSRVSAWNALPLAVRLFTGKIGGAASVTRLRAERFVIERPAPGFIHTDGEVRPAPAVIEVTVRPASLRIVVPPDVP
jgi:hypothetical protein